MEQSYGNKVSFKYFIGYTDETNIFPISLYIKLHQMNIYVKYFDNNNKYMSFLVYGEELLKNMIKYGMKIKIYLKNNFLVNQCIIINTLK